MLFSVIIPTCNRNDLLALCLDKLAPEKQSLQSVLYEVIVTDDSKAYAAENFTSENYIWVKYIRGPQKGPASNRNNGALAAKGKWLIFLDDDCIPDTGLLINYQNLIQDNPMSRAFEGAIRPERNKQSALEHAPINLNGSLFWSCNCCVKKNLFDGIGGFDANFKFPHMEDIDLKERLLKNTVIIFGPLAFVTHPWRKIVSGKKLGLYHEADFYYFQQKKGFRIFLLKLVKDIIVHRVNALGEHFSIKALAIISYNLFFELMIVLSNYKKWSTKYPVREI